MIRIDSVQPPPPFLQGGIEPPTKFSKEGGSLAGPQLLEEDYWERGDDFFEGGFANVT